MRFLSAFVVLTLIVSFAVSAEVRVSGDFSKLNALAQYLHDDGPRLSAQSAESKSAVMLSVNGGTLGRLRILLPHIQGKDWDSYIEGRDGVKRKDPKQVVLVQGVAVDSKGNRIPVGGSLYRPQDKPVLHLIFNGGRKIKRAYYLKVNLDEGRKARISGVPEFVQDALPCGGEFHRSKKNEEHDQGHDHSAVSRSGLNSLVGIKSTSGTLTVGTDADPAFYAAYGENTNAHIATLISAASSIYRNDIGISLRVGSQHAFTSSVGNPYTSTDSSVLLSQFKNYALSANHLGIAQAYHMFSGLDFNLGVVGLAWVGVVCAAPQYAYGITQKYHPAADASIFAHELGHNVGADHDSTDSRSLMAPYVNIPGSTYMSTTTKNEINQHFAESPSCLGDPSSDDGSGGGGGGGAAPTDPSDPGSGSPSLSLRSSASSNGRLTIKVTLDQQPSSNCSVALTVGSKASSLESLYQFVPVSTITTIRVAGVKDPRASNSKIYFGASITCDGGVTSASDTSSANLDKVSSKISGGVAKVVKALKKAFSA